ncbi:DUF726 domain-containing protein [Halorubrum ezzemoulense]|uniref:DUF726 domain-containing protein n=1 Tax=Halorubrum ezzemoulense TaxID=337243 RepID=UPI00232D3291|nr:DUF726 domain-containing protein [Halorubrum ezzemoulense]MDB9232746.1 DUF726 domain-containing protein [Halorubrum ezzemoulense]
MVSTRGRLDADEPTTRSGSWEFGGSDAVVLYVHGLGADAESARDQAYAARLGLAAASDSAGGDDAAASVPPVIGYSWSSNDDWGPAKRTADANAAPLADWLTAWADEDGRPAHVFAHSLGARVTGATLRELADRGRTDALASVSLFGGAIPHDSVGTDGAYGAAIGALDAPLYNFHSRNDRVLGWVYRASDRTRAVGHGGLSGAATAPDGYADIDVSDLVADHYSYLEPNAGSLPRAIGRIGFE